MGLVIGLQSSRSTSNVDASLIVQCLTELRPLLTAGKIGEVKAFFQTAPLQLLRSGLENFLLYLQETYQWLPSGRLVTSKREGQRKLSASKRFVNYDAAKIERASLAHQETLSELSSFLQTRGFRVECNMYVDAFSRLKTGPAFFEAKSISEDNELEQVRGALSQLYEYRFRHRLYGATLWIVLSKAPQLSWLSEYLINDREVNLLWIENGVLAGPSMEAIDTSYLTDFVNGPRRRIPKRPVLPFHSKSNSNRKPSFRSLLQAA